MATQKYLHGEARVIRAADDHTPLNHGQISVEVILPHGAFLTGFGECGPHWVQHGNSEIDWSSATIESEHYDATLSGFVPAPIKGSSMGRMPP